MTYEPVTLDHLLAHQTWAIRMARRLVHEEGEAEELVQRTWLAALRRPPDTERGARAWIRRVLQNLAHERHRRVSTRERYERQSLDERREEPEAFESLSRKEIHALLADRLLALSEPYRQVLTKRFYEDLSSVEIGRRLGIPAGTVRWRLKVGLDQLRAELDRRSHGDRSRWLSALLLFAPAPAGGGAATASDAKPASAASAAPAGLTWLTSAGWIGLVAVLVGAGWYVSRDETRAPESADLALAAAPRSAADATPGNQASVARTPLSGSALGATPAGLAASAGLRVLVVDPRGEPVPGATILAAGAQGFEPRAVTDAEGNARVDVQPEDLGALNLPATRGRVALRALAPGCVASELWHVGPPFDGGHEVRIPVGGEEHVIRGRVLDQDGAPVVGATLTWFDLRARLAPITSSDFPSPSFLATRSDERGAFELGHLSAGNETLFCLADGFALQDAEVDFRGRAAEVEVRMERGAIVTGVVRWPGGTPAAGVRLAFEPAQKGSEWAAGLPQYDPSWHGFTETARTEADGSFRMEGVTPGKRTLWAEANELVASVDLDLVVGGREHWDAELGKRPGLHLRFVDEAQRPLAGWIVFLRQVSGDAWWIRNRETDAEGRVVVADCPPGGAFLDVFDASGFGASYLGRRVLPGDQEQVIAVETRDRGSLTGVLLDSLGQPVVDGKLTACSRRTALFLPVERDAEGRFDVRLGAGNYVLLLEQGRSACRLAQFTLAAGEARDLGTLAVPAPGTLRLSAAALSASGKGSYSLYVLFDETRNNRAVDLGHASLESEELLTLFPGRYSLLVFDGSDAPPQTHVVRISSYGETRVDLGR